MITNYNVISRKGNIKKYRDESCFSGIYYNISEIDKVRIFILNEYPYEDVYTASDDFSFKEKKEICIYLREMGFFVSDPHKTDIGNIEGERFIVPGTYIDLYTGNMTSAASLFCLHAIRYLYEDNFTVITKKFLEWAPVSYPEVSLFNKFLLAHYVRTSYYNENHTFIYTHNKINSFISEEEFKRIILNRTQSITNLRSLLPYNMYTIEDVAKLSRLINRNSFSEVIAYYNLLLSKKGIEKFDDGF